MRKKLIYIIIFIIIVIAMGLAVIILKKQDESNDYTIKLNNKFAENEKVKISIENVGYVDDYLILKYDVIAKDESSELFDDSMVIDGKFDFHLPRRILLNNKTIETSLQYYDQISHKVSDKEAVLYDVIDVGGENIPDKFELEIRFYENDYTVYEKFDESEVGEDETNEIDEDEDYSQIEFEIDSNTIQSVDEDKGFLEEYATEDDYEEVVGEYVFENKHDEEKEKMLDDEETAVIGVIAFKATKAEMMNNCEESIIDGEYAIDNVNVERVMVVKTPFGNFLLMDTKISDVSGEVIYRNTVSDPYTYDVDVQDENGASVKMDKAQEVHIYYGRQNEGNTANIRTLILLDSGLDVFIIQPYYDCENAETIGDGFFVEV